jgi:hypothetical protein
VNKVILNQKEVQALDSALDVSGNDKASVVHWHSQNLWDGNRQCLNELDLDTVIRALYVGYEIEESPISCGDDVMGDEVLKGDYILEYKGEMILETNVIDYLVDILGATRKVAGE